MNKTLIATLIAGLAFGANAANLDNLKVSGFGTFTVGQANNDVGYAGYESNHAQTEQDTVAGIQFDYTVNANTKATMQITTQGRNDYKVEIAQAYISHDFDGFTARVGKMRTPFFMFSDYLSVGYAYPMIRPSQEVYEQVIVDSYTGANLLIPFDIGETTLELQPFAGKSEITKEHSAYGKIDLNNFAGLAANWSVDDFTFRASYATAKTDYSSANNQGLMTSIAGTTVNAQMPAGSAGSVQSVGAKDTMTAYLSSSADEMLDNKRVNFVSVGAQYDNGSLLALIEGMQSEMSGAAQDVRAVSGLVGYHIDAWMPYISVRASKTTDNNERGAHASDPVFKEMDYLNQKRIAYSVGSRWDMAQNLALKLDVTYVDFDGTSGGYKNNWDATKHKAIEDGTMLYSAAVNYVF